MPGGDPASMRPRHKAAENEVHSVRIAPNIAASMRPRHKAAENDAGVAPVYVRRPASMRPRHKAAENGRVPGQATRYGPLASMRPRHKAAENHSGNSHRESMTTFALQ